MNFRDERLFRIGTLADAPGLGDLMASAKEHIEKQTERLLTLEQDEDILRLQREIKGAKDLLQFMQSTVERYSMEYQALIEESTQRSPLK